jgi:hypothetical protein
LCSLLHSPATSALLDATAPCSQTQSIYVLPLVYETKFVYFKALRNKLFSTVRICYPPPKPRTGGSPLVGYPACLFHIFASTLHIWSPLRPPSLPLRLAMPWWQWPT